MFRLWRGVQCLSIEMGRRLHMACIARVCLLCPGMHIGDGRRHVSFALCSGFDRPFGKFGAAPCQGPDADGALLSCNLVYCVLGNAERGGPCPPPSISRQWQRAQPPGDLRGPSIPVLVLWNLHLPLQLLDDSHWEMCLFMWHSYQKGAAYCLLQMLDNPNNF